MIALVSIVFAGIVANAIKCLFAIAVVTARERDAFFACQTSPSSFAGTKVGAFATPL